MGEMAEAKGGGGARVTPASSVQFRLVHLDTRRGVVRSNQDDAKHVHVTQSVSPVSHVKTPSHPFQPGCSATH